MSDVDPLSAEAVLAALETMTVDGRDETSRQAKLLLESYRAGQCEKNWQLLCELFVARNPAVFRPSVVEASELRITINGQLTKFCPFCGGEFPKHRLPTVDGAVNAVRVPYAAI